MKLWADIDGDDNWEYVFQADYGTSISVDADESSTTMPLPGKDAESSLVMSYMGEEKEINVQLTLINDGTDKANGTAPQDGTFSDTTGNGTEDVVTVEEQYRYLENYIKDPGVSRKNKIENGGFMVNGLKGRITGVTGDEDSENPNELPVTIKMVVGTVM